MTDEKYIQNQKRFIKRERKIILRNHWTGSCWLLFLLAVLILITAGYGHPNNWQETTITLESYEIVPTGRAGSRLDIYDTAGNRYTVNRNEGNIKAQLAVGQQYTFTYANGFFHDTVEVIQIDGVEYLDYDGSVKNYWGTKTIFWVLIGILSGGLAVINFFVYKTSTYDRIKKIRKYQQRIYDKEHKRTC